MQILYINFLYIIFYTLITFQICKFWNIFYITVSSFLNLQYFIYNSLFLYFSSFYFIFFSNKFIFHHFLNFCLVSLYLHILILNDTSRTKNYQNYATFLLFI